MGTPPQISVSASPELVGRGDYLVNHVVGCVLCHSQRDWQYFSGPIKVESIGGGGKIYDESNGFPGHVRAGNITPSALDEWSDGEVITELDKMKISLAVDRFWARRGMEGFVERNHRGGVLRTLAKVEELEAAEDE